MMTQEKFDRAKQCLIDNGIESDEANIVLQALCYILMNEETEQYFEEEKEMSIEEMWDYLIERGIATEEELQLVTSINGYNEETMEDVLYVRTGERTLKIMRRNFNMFIFRDKFYKNTNGDVFTKEYLEHNGHFDGYVWKVGSREYKMMPAEEIRYEYGSSRVIRCNYSQLFNDNDNLILCNNIASNSDALELENGNDYDEENDTYEDIYQWYIIDDGLADSLKRHTDEIVYYHNELDVYVLGVTHFGTGWDYVAAEYKM